MRSTFGVLTPVTRDPYAPEEQAALQAAVHDGLVDALWVRDLPCAPAGDPDVGQGHDPFAHIAWLAGQGLLPRTVGVASVVMGTRHPLVVARAAVGAQVHTGGGFVLGLGSGGKPPVSAALGVADRSLDEFRGEWFAIERALHGGGTPAGSIFPLPDDFRPPPMWLASDDVEKWAAVGETAGGWLTFFASPRTLLGTYDHVVAARGDGPAVGVRLDLNLVSADEEPATVSPPVRGVVTCSLSQLAQVLRPVRDLPVDHVLLNLLAGGADGVRRVRDVWDAAVG